ncbi:glycosyltransferase [Candidatus Kaiserbacteria bacterium]|nr:glycosyltransferase [Candidatus Kaiserbacteria bacterium]
MNPEMLAYPFLFIAIFFESFVLVTLLSKPARLARLRRAGERTDESALPSVAVMVPCWNEASTIGATCDSLLALQYPKEKLEIILVDDGSTDTTKEAMSRFKEHPQIRIIHKENGGKHTALNAGIAITNAELIGCLDADSFAEPDALREIVSCFYNPQVVAATAAMSIHQPGNILQHMQNAEYAFGITLRHAFASINGLYVTPGPFSFYRREIVIALGGFRYGHQTEDMEMALRIQHAGYEIENAPRARVYTKAPSTIAKLMNQRTRWISGFLRNILGEYRNLICSRNHGVLGMLILPGAILSVASGILLFALMLFLFARNTVTALEVREGIPLYYALLPHGTLDWFYLPVGSYTLLAIIVLLASIALITIGRSISKTTGGIFIGLISYTFLYGLITPFWLFRAVSDVARGKRRGWRY